VGHIPQALGGLAIFLLLCSSGSQGNPVPQEGPCSKSQTQLELTRCWGTAAQDAELRLSRSSAQVSSQLRTRKSKDVTILLQDSDAKWQAYKDAQCAFESRLYEGGSMEGMQRDVCRARLADQRRNELKSVVQAVGSDEGRPSPN
jgi:uncharacterized protein YecT (DUF1311 family)